MSGLAFRVRWYAGKGCPCALCGETKIANAALKKAIMWKASGVDCTITEEPVMWDVGDIADP